MFLFICCNVIITMIIIRGWVVVAIMTFMLVLTSAVSWRLCACVTGGVVKVP